MAHILVVDDRAINREFLATLLGDARLLVQQTGAGRNLRSKIPGVAFFGG